jgi:hypothetical protein
VLFGGQSWPEGQVERSSVGPTLILIFTPYRDVKQSRLGVVYGSFGKKDLTNLEVSSNKKKRIFLRLNTNIRWLILHRRANDMSVEARNPEKLAFFVAVSVTFLT